MESIGLIVLWIFLTGFLAIGFVAIRRRDVPGQSDGMIESCCSGCGYLLTGLPGHQCPECGANLVRDGVDIFIPMDAGSSRKRDRQRARPAHSMELHFHA